MSPRHLVDTNIISELVKRRPNPGVVSWAAGVQVVGVSSIGRAIAERAGRWRGALRARGQSLSQADLLLAATAAELDLLLVTRNIKDFKGCDVSLLDPFS